VFAYTHGTHLLKHIRKPRRKPHRNRLVPSRLTIGTHPPNFPCWLLPFNWLGDFSVLSRATRELLSLFCVAFVYSPPPHNTPDRQNLMPPILARLQMILAMAPTFVSDKRRCSPYTGIHRRDARETGRKVGCDVSILTSFISQKYASYIPAATSIYHTYCSATLPYDFPQTLSASRYIIHYDWWYGVKFFIERKLVSNTTIKFLNAHTDRIYFIVNYFHCCSNVTEIKYDNIMFIIIVLL